jgi:hypothetical protein
MPGKEGGGEGWGGRRRDGVKGEIRGPIGIADPCQSKVQAGLAQLQVMSPQI